MNEFILSCCSTADLTREHFERRNISYVCFHFELNGVEYSDDLGASIPFKDFYKAMEDDAETKTSQVNVSEYIEYFENFLKRGQDILHVCLSSGLSGTYNSAVIAADTLLEKYPQRKLFVIDSLAASSGYGLFMDALADQRDSGKSIEDLKEWARTHKLLLNHWFFSTDLKYYIKGGRISKASGMIGSILGICPLLNMDSDGKLKPRAKIRGKQKVIRRIVDCMEESAEGGLNYSGKCYISQSDCIDDAKKVADMVESRFPRLNGKVLINYVGTTIGSHTGPGTVALFFWGKQVRA